MRNKTLSAIVALSGLAAVAMPAGARVKKDETPLYKNASAPVEKRVNELAVKDDAGREDNAA